VDEVNRIQAGVRLAPARKEFAPGADSSSYLVGHAAQVIAFGTDGLARLEYPFGVRQEDWANDLPKLARGEAPTVMAPNDTTPVTWQPGAAAESAPLPPIQIEVAIMPAPPSTTEAGVFLVIRNNAEADTLIEVSSPIAQRAAIHRTTTSGGMQHMEHAGSLPLPAGAVTMLKPGDMHVMLMGLSRQPAAGESVPLRLRFARGNEMVLAVTVIPYAEVERALAGQR
jgi:hypothetical protein